MCPNCLITGEFDSIMGRQTANKIYEQMTGRPVPPVYPSLRPLRAYQSSSSLAQVLNSGYQFVYGYKMLQNGCVAKLCIMFDGLTRTNLHRPVEDSRFAQYWTTRAMVIDITDPYGNPVESEKSDKYYMFASLETVHHANPTYLRDLYDVYHVGYVAEAYGPDQAISFYLTYEGAVNDRLMMNYSTLNCYASNAERFNFTGPYYHTDLITGRVISVSQVVNGRLVW